MTIEIFKLFGSIGIKNQEANKAIDETTGKAKDSSGKIGAIFSKLAGFLGTLFAGKVLFDFGRSVVQAAANAKAIESQFVQVFGSIEKEARSKLDEVAKQAGALPNRIKPAFNQIASFAKVTGMDAKTSLDFTARATAAAADSAAFYDKSLEETTDTLKSYLKGNYEVADNLGILSTETTRNEAATRMFGQAFKDLSGEQQQQVLLQMYEDANKVSGAMGQAARESDGFENVMGNLRQAWEDFKASIGGAVLQPVVAGLQAAVEWIKAAREWLGKLKVELQQNGAIKTFSEAFNNLKDIFSTVSSSISEFINRALGLDQSKTSVDGVASAIKDVAQFLKDATENIQGFINWFQQGGMAVDILKSSIMGIVFAWGAYKLVTGTIAIIEGAKNLALGIGNGLMLARLVQTGALTAAEGAHAAATVAGTGAMAAFNAVMAINPFVLLIAAIAVVVGALIWFFTQTETGRKIWGDFTKWLGDVWNSLKQNATQTFNQLSSSVSKAWNDIKSSAEKTWNSITGTISSVIDKAKNIVKTGVDTIKGMFNFKWSLPHITLPHFRVSGGQAPWGFMGKGSLPSVGVDWYAKGGIMTAPTLFGINGDRAMVGGEAGPEAVLPLNSKTLGQIGQGIQNATSDENSAIVSLLSQMVDLLDELLDKDIDILIDGDSVVAKTWQKTQEKIEFSNKRNKRLRGEV
ncbi:phage tail tape measure protein [Streptococcus uberis]|uniref:phage tail tape measure protein n=1 Tax=Streptococcus uberis TaxID=1349 RepID=UPI001EF068CE|nr:phage tail tape measure protein [Streptococcus uberis]